MLLRIALLLVSTLLLNGCASVISATTGGEGVQEDRGRRSLGATLDDGSIETNIKVNLNAADERLKNSHINVVSYNGVVLLVGQVASQDLKNMASRVANSQSRVKVVHNELEIGPASSLLVRSSDALLTSKLKTLMLADPTVAGMRIKVVTENSVVYLMGLVTQQEAKLASDLVAQSAGVTKVVRAFEYID